MKTFYVMRQNGDPLGVIEASDVAAAQSMADAMWSGRVVVRDGLQAARYDRLFCRVKQSIADGAA